MAMSPDGSQIIILKTGHENDNRFKPGWDEIEIISSDTGEAALNIKQSYSYNDTSSNWAIGWVYWPFDDVILANGVEFTVSGRKWKTRSAFVTINPKTGEITPISSSRRGKAERDLSFSKLIASNARTREVALAVPDDDKTQLQLINVDTGEKRVLDESKRDVLSWLLDSEMRPVMRIERSDSGAVDFYYASYDGGTTWDLRFKNDWLNQSFIPVTFLNDARAFAVLARPPGAERAGLFEYSLADGKFGENLFDVEEYDLSNAVAKRRDDGLLYASYWEDSLKKHWFDEDAGRMGRAIDRAVPEGTNWSIIDMSADSRDWIIFQSSPSDPGSFHVFRRDTKSLRKISRARPGIDASVTSPTVRFDYTASDGVALRGYFTPSTIYPHSAPLIVMPHGGPAVRDHLDWDGWAQFFAFRGYSVFQPQFRGSGGFGRSFERLGDGEWGEKMQTDISDGVKALEDAGLVDPARRRSIVGASYGGYAALAAATMTPDAYQCAVSYAGVSDLNRFLTKFDRADAVDAFSQDLWVQRMNNGRFDEAELAARSPISYIDQLKAQVFVIHGDADEIVPPDQTTEFYNAVLRAGKYARLLMLEDTGHQIYDDDTDTRLLVAMDDFLMRCMPPPRRPRTSE